MSNICDGESLRNVLTYDYDRHVCVAVHIIIGPFCIIQEILKEDDQFLKDLKDEFGEEIYNAVVTALKEVNEYNPSGRYMIRELWNLKENRKVSPKEVISDIFRQMKSLKRKLRQRYCARNNELDL